MLNRRGFFRLLAGAAAISTNLFPRLRPIFRLTRVSISKPAVIPRWRVWEVIGPGLSNEEALTRLEFGPASEKGEKA